MDIREYAPYGQSLISLNSFHLYLLYFDSCHNLNGCFPILFFMCYTFVVQFWIEVFNDIVRMTSSKFDVISTKFASLTHA